MTNRQLQLLKKKYIREGYKMGLKKASKKMLNEAASLDASEIEEIIDAQSYGLNKLKNYVTVLTSKTDYNKIVYFTSEAMVESGRSQYGFTLNVDTDNKDLVINRVGFRNKNNKQYITLSFNMSHPRGREAFDDYNRGIQIDLSNTTINDAIRQINDINETYS